MMPTQKPGKSNQSYQTPPEFLNAVKYLLNISEFGWDLAATPGNAVCKQYFCPNTFEEFDGLKSTWSKVGWSWLNPPFSDITPWVKKAAQESADGARIAMLVPASVGSNWWANWVDGNAQVMLLHGRITFVGCTTPYPKDCALLLYSPYITGGYSTFHWQKLTKTPKL